MMNRTEKFIVPMVLSNSEAILYKNKFYVGAYTADINTPYLYQHIFLMFKSDAVNNSNLYAIFSKNNYYYNSYSKTINGEFYTIFSFLQPPTIKRSLKLLIDGAPASILSDELRLKIAEHHDLRVTDPLYHEVYQCTQYDLVAKQDTIPEEDYFEPIDIFDI